MIISIQFVIINQLDNKSPKNWYSTNIDETIVSGTSKTSIIFDLFAVVSCAALDTQ